MQILKIHKIIIGSNVIFVAKYQMKVFIESSNILLGFTEMLVFVQNVQLKLREEIIEYTTKKKTEKEEMNMLPHFDESANELEDDDDDVVEVDERGRRPLGQGSEVSSTHSTTSKPKKPKQKGPMDVFFTPNPDAVVQNRKIQGKQTRIDENDPYRKELRERARQRFARWIYDAEHPLNAVNYDSFGPMIEAIGKYGTGMKPPTYHEL